MTTEQASEAGGHVVAIGHARVAAVMPTTDDRSPGADRTDELLTQNDAVDKVYQLLAQNEPLFPGAWEAERARVRAVRLNLFRRALVAADPLAINRQLNFAVREQPESRITLMKEVLCRVSELLDRRPDPTAVNAALKRVEMLDPDKWDDAALDKIPTAFSVLDDLIEGSGLTARWQERLELWSKDTRFQKTDFTDILQTYRRRRDELWMPLLLREREANRFALALAIAVRAGADETTRLALRRRAARAWYDRTFKSLEFPGKDAMTALDASSAEALWEALVRSRYEGQPVFVRRTARALYSSRADSSSMSQDRSRIIYADDLAERPSSWTLVAQFAPPSSSYSHWYSARSTRGPSSIGAAWNASRFSSVRARPGWGMTMTGRFTWQCVKIPRKPVGCYAHSRAAQMTSRSRNSSDTPGD